MKRLIPGIVVITGVWFFLDGAPVPAQDAELQRKINAAVDNGVEYLKKFDWQGVKEGQPFGPNLTNHGLRAGAMALGGWTLLECGVSPKDKSVQELANQIRQAVPTLTFNYAVSTSLIFLDKLDDPGDFHLIESLALRLIAGQTRYGGWHYHCPPCDAAEVRRLNDLTAANGAKRARGEAIPRVEKLSAPIVKQLEKIVGRAAQFMEDHEGDNSNTQF